MISLNWLKDYVDYEDDANELAVKITKAGVNVEKVISKRINNLVIGKVVSCIPHSDSDHLHICNVNIGSECVQIVCGAPNVREGIKVIVALPNAVLPGDFVIKESTIRGVSSKGMLCALFELGLEEKNDINYAKGIYEVDNTATVGMDANVYLGIDDVVYELDVHKHRNNDCYYHIGFAYEVASILNKKVSLPDTTYNEVEDNINNHFTLEVDTDKCKYYLAKMVKDVHIGPSPEFIKKRLTSVGMRSINNVVDISNYVMLEFGQPTHFFDYDSLGNKIVVRDANDNEAITTLDGKDRVLNKSDIVITNGNIPVCIAGVMGGVNTEVEENTKNILIESAIFDGISIRNTANRLNLKSEASIRYGKGLNYEYTKLAIDRACHLLEKYAGATILSGMVCYDKLDKTQKEIVFAREEVNKILGLNLSDEDIKCELDRLGFTYTYSDNKFDAIIPNRRIDIDPYVNDIAEEIGRLYGYHNLTSTLPKLTTKRGRYMGDVQIRKDVSKRLRMLGLNECITYTLTSPSMASMFKYDKRDNIVLPNPMSVDKSVIRTSILPSLMNIYEYNKSRGVKDILIYEISKTYDKEYKEISKVAMVLKGSYLSNSWQNKDINIDFYVVKGIVENLLNYLGFKNRYSFEEVSVDELHPYMSAKVLVDKDNIGIIGRVHPTICSDEVYVCELSLTSLYNKKIKPIKYKEVSKYPTIVKDVAFIVDKDIESGSIEKTIRKEASKLLEDVYLFDYYEKGNIGEDKKSLAFKLTFSDSNKTLEEKEVMEIFNNLIKVVVNKYNAVLRDK